MAALVDPVCGPSGFSARSELDWWDSPFQHRHSPHTSCPAKELTMPWFTRQWSWPPILSYSEAELQLSANDLSPPPTSDGNSKRPKLRPQRSEVPDTVHMLLQNPTLYNPLRVPRYPIVLCHGA
jgi:triacylglycerol lipase